MCSVEAYIYSTCDVQRGSVRLQRLWCAAWKRTSTALVMCSVEAYVYSACDVQRGSVRLQHL